MVAFAMVFAHSIIPHCHHCDDYHSHVGHFHGNGNCELIDTYLISDSDDLPQVENCVIELIPAVALCEGLPVEGKRIIFDLRDKLPDKSLSGLPCQGLRAPPTA